MIENIKETARHFTKELEFLKKQLLKSKEIIENDKKNLYPKLNQASGAGLELLEAADKISDKREAEKN